MDVILLMIVGGFNSGRTAFLQATSEIEVVSTEPIEHDPSKIVYGLGFGRVTIDDNLVLYLFCNSNSGPLCPIEERVSAERRPYCGYIVVANSVFEECRAHTHEGWVMPSHDRELLFILDWVSQRGLPYLVVADNQNEAAARSVEEMRRGLQLSDDIQLLSCSAKTDPASVRRAVRELLKLLPQDEIVQRAIARLEKMDR